MVAFLEVGEMLALWRDLLSLIFPSSMDCPLCGGERDGKDFCNSCYSIVSSYKQELYCSRCGRFAGKDSVIPRVSQHYCYICRKKQWPFELVRAAGPYEGVLKETIHRFKYLGRKNLASSLAGLMVESARMEPLLTCVDLVLPVPLADEKLRARGFNQAGLLAEEVGYRLQLPVNHKLLVKDFDTQPQVGLDRVAREKNLKGAFRVTNTGVIQGKNIMIIDDVFTTGNTMSSVAMVVRSAGAGNIFGLTVAAGRYF